jgi:inosose dehydratase
MMTRRTFLSHSALWTGATAALPHALVSTSAAPASGPALHLACNQYVWHVFYQREKRQLEGNLDQALGEMAAAGLNGFEPLVTSPAQIEQTLPLLKKHRIEMRSLYVNSTLHEQTQIQRSHEDILAIARAAKPAGTRIIVTNPSPIRWGSQEDKSDQQLQRQAAALNQLGHALAQLNLQLAYHYHDPELRQAAREFHHMMVGTDPAVVHLCLDTHWVYRGAGNSQVALFDILELYASRVCELHLRQSKNHVWTETLEAGDIDHPRLARRLSELGRKPHLVLEQAVEGGTPHTLDVVEAHRRSVRYAREVFAPLA